MSFSNKKNFPVNDMFTVLHSERSSKYAEKLEYSNSDSFSGNTQLRVKEELGALKGKEVKILSENLAVCRNPYTFVVHIFSPLFPFMIFLLCDLGLLPPPPLLWV